MPPSIAAAWIPVTGSNLPGPVHTTTCSGETHCTCKSAATLDTYRYDSRSIICIVANIKDASLCNRQILAALSSFLLGTEATISTRTVLLVGMNLQKAVGSAGFRCNFVFSSEERRLRRLLQLPPVASVALRFCNNIAGPIRIFLSRPSSSGIGKPSCPNICFVSILVVSGVQCTVLLGNSSNACWEKEREYKRPRPTFETNHNKHDPVL
mmetsp:Transcript_43042/g.124479  ORF Transcript_43042/g.124479 Transcript_43042/m.124479 type:complete len:210 (-) Transcript_43042:7-636(-)